MGGNNVRNYLPLRGACASVCIRDNNKKCSMKP